MKRSSLAILILSLSTVIAVYASTKALNRARSAERRVAELESSIKRLSSSESALTAAQAARKIETLNSGSLTEQSSEIAEKAQIRLSEETSSASSASLDTSHFEKLFKDAPEIAARTSVMEFEKFLELSSDEREQLLELYRKRMALNMGASPNLGDDSDSNLHDDQRVVEIIGQERYEKYQKESEAALKRSIRENYENEAMILSRRAGLSSDKEQLVARALETVDTESSAAMGQAFADAEAAGQSMNLINQPQLQAQREQLREAFLRQLLQPYLSEQELSQLDQYQKNRSRMP